jgi:hypothetical protein
MSFLSFLDDEWSLRLACVASVTYMEFVSHLHARIEL